MEPLEPRDVPSYTIVDLGVLPDYDTSTAWGINDAGQVVGTTQRPFSARGFLWSEGQLRDVGSLGGDSRSYAYGVNALGQVVGSATVAENVFHAYVWSDGVMVDLEPGGDEVNSAARGINAVGDVVGDRNGTMGKQGQHAFLYRKGVLNNLNDLVPPGTGWVMVQARGVNDLGQVAGLARTPQGEAYRGYIWNEGELVILDTLGGNHSEVGAINDHGYAVGAATNANEEAHAFLYVMGVMFDLGTLGGKFSSASGINNVGQIVGSSATSQGFRAFIHQGGVMTDLNTLLPAGSGWLVTDAYGVNDAGQIVGEGEINGQIHAFLMTPTGGAPAPGNDADFRFAADVCALLHAKRPVAFPFP